MEHVLEEKEHDCEVHTLTYEHGTHFLFPQSMLKKILPIGGGLLPKLAFKAARDYPKECKNARLDVDKRVEEALAMWIKSGRL